ncbi:ZPR1 zinc-finger domain-containing protein [Pterulicium gracile]|uniref:ZPR1 zinc-finger domain-containing protein n=1 Tax=Pterulicium gracile TaxID=1884261 RepID=A0A5C3QU82_9AGAR|nr:ZPR1 zinc-finger domain-containing protein [Pterula gracilis]
MSTTTTDFFPKIGDIAAETDAGNEDQEDGDKLVQEIESLCMKCQEQGMTRMMLTTIPYFRQVIVMSFNCEHCGTSNNEVQSAGEIRTQGTLYTVHVSNKEDLSRQLVRSASCTVYISTLELTLPAPLETYLQDPHSVARPSGLLTTIEGLLRSIHADLSSGQPLRRALDEAAYTKIDSILTSLRAVLPDIDDDLEETQGRSQPERDDDDTHTFTPFTLQLDDPAGNSFIEFLNAASTSSETIPTGLPGTIDDSRWSMRTYERSKAQDVMLGLAQPDEDEGGESALGVVKEDEEVENPEEVYVFPGTCSSCKQPLDTKMKKVNIPYFQDILIMSTNCQNCGYRDNEIKSGSAISEKGKKIIVKIEDREDLSRDLLKSDTAALTIPEIDLHLGHGTLGGRFTTIEGILSQIYEELGEKVFFAGDSAASRINKDTVTAKLAAGEEPSDLEKYTLFLGSLKGLYEERDDGSQPEFTLIIDDPLANSYVQNPYAPDEDPNMVVEIYERSFDQNEELGLNDIDVGEHHDGRDAEPAKEDDSQK